MPSMGRRVDVSHLTEEECNKVLNVISKDILIRKSEKERISYLTKKFDDLRRAVILSNSRRKKLLPFDDYCLLCGKHLFTFCCFFQRGEECISCEHSCCTDCRKILVVETHNGTDEMYICKLCLQKREVKGKTMEWYYELVEKRFKRCGSAKALRAIYKQRKSIEPRVITLLAMCREIQPARKISFTSMKKRYRVSNYSKEDDKVEYSSSYSDMDGTYVDRVRFSSNRRRNLSESDALDLMGRDTNDDPEIGTLPRTQSDATEFKRKTSMSSAGHSVDEALSKLNTGVLEDKHRVQRVQSYDYVKGSIVRRKTLGNDGPPVLKFSIKEEHEMNESAERDAELDEGTRKNNRHKTNQR